MQQSSDDPLLNLNINDSLGGASELGVLISNLIGKVQTITLVKVMGVNASGVSPVGSVDVVPLVSQIDGAGNLYQMPTLLNVPYFRLQGGSNAVICDPSVGDIGLCGFASRDISAVKRNKGASGPASRRQYDISDGLYIGGFLNGTPSQYVYFKGSGIDIVSTGEVNITGTKINLNAPVATSSTLQSASEITDMAESGNSQTMSSMRETYNEHTHVSNGDGSNTNPPNQQV